MSNILAFDTTSNLSVSVLEADKILVKRSINISGKQSEMLVLEIEQALSQANLTYQDLDFIAVTKGPGSFTAVRIGTVTAQTLKLALNIPIIAVTGNEVLAFKNSTKKTAIDAGMDEFYCAEFEFKNGLPQQIGDISLVKSEDLDDSFLQGSFDAQDVGFLAYEKIKQDGIDEDSAALYIRQPRIG